MPVNYRIIQLTLTLTICIAAHANGADWPRFRGPTGMGVSDDKKAPVTWSDSKNIKWKKAMPGAGSSSPIVFGDRVYITCYSGYGNDGGSVNSLKRHLICLDRNSGKIVWDKTIKASLPEDSFRGYLTEHGYATHTPVTDGERIYAFFGKSGVFAFDMNGKQMWHKMVGTESGAKRWGSASSPILYKETVIINASDESQSIRAFDKKTGKQKWKAEAASLENTFGTPLIVNTGGRDEMVLAVPYEVWGLNPDTGKLNWYAEIPMDNNISPSVVVADGVAYAFGGYRTKGSVAVKVGGKGDAKSNVLWQNRFSTYVPSPVHRNDHLYFVNDTGTAYCIHAKSGKIVYSEDLNVRGRGKPFYASATLVNGNVICVSRRNGTYVIAANTKYKQVAHNKIASDDSDFNASPAISNGQMFLRSNRFLYCIESN